MHGLAWIWQPTHFHFGLQNCSCTGLCRFTLILPRPQLQAVDWWQLKGIDEGIGTNINVSYPKLTFDILYRYTYLLSRVMFPMIWFMHYVHFLTSVTWHATMFLILNPLQLCRMPSIVSINIERFSVCVVFFHHSTFLVNIHLPISFKWFRHSVPPMDSVHLSLNRNTSKPLRSPIGGQVITKPLVKCYWLTNVWTSSQQCKLISRGTECWMAHACHIHFSCSTSLVSLIYISICIILTNL